MRPAITYRTIWPPAEFQVRVGFAATEQVISVEGKELGTMDATTFRRWNSGDLPVEVGKHTGIQLFPGVETRMSNGFGEVVPVQFLLDLEVTARRYVGRVPLTEMRGFRDERDGSFISDGSRVGKAPDGWRLLEPDEAVPDYVVGIHILDEFILDGPRGPV